MTTRENNIYLISIIFLILLPQFVLYVSINHLFTILLLSIFLFFVVRISKIIFYLFLLYIAFIDLIQMNITFHWGTYVGDISSRISVAMQSPTSETIEYMQEYIGFLDITVVIYLSVILCFSANFLINYQKNYAEKYTYLFIVIALAILQNQEPLKTIKYFFQTAEMNKAILKRANMLEDTNAIVKSKKNGFYDKVIIIQGESVNKNFMGIYNPKYKTTPFFQSLQRKENFYYFNAISASNQTRYSVPTTFTDANVDNWYEEYSRGLSLVTDFKENGYKSYWLSTQGEQGEHEDSITSIAKETDIQYFAHDSIKKDAVLIEYLNKNCDIKKGRELYVFHIMGSHFSYEDRYPKNIFSNASTFVQKYKNSIRYTDSIIEQILKYFNKNSDSFLLIYLSDHGEVVSEKKHGHGYLPSYKEEYEIPFCIYSSSKNNRLEKFYNQNINKLLNSENMNSYIKYISGISDSVAISYSTNIFSLDPKNKFDYNELNRYDKE